MDDFLLDRVESVAADVPPIGGGLNLSGTRLANLIGGGDFLKRFIDDDVVSSSNVNTESCSSSSSSSLDDSI